MTGQSPPRQNFSPWRFATLASGVGVTFVVIVLMFAGLGWLARRYLGAGEIGLVGGVMLGVWAGFFVAYRRVGAMLRALFPPRGA
jgi:F0F1-type ATP synthase assembly protein I